MVLLVITLIIHSYYTLNIIPITCDLSALFTKWQILQVRLNRFNMWTLHGWLLLSCPRSWPPRKPECSWRLICGQIKVGQKPMLAPPRAHTKTPLPEETIRGRNLCCRGEQITFQRCNGTEVGLKAAAEAAATHYWVVSWLKLQQL